MAPVLGGKAIGRVVRPANSGSEGARDEMMPWSSMVVIRRTSSRLVNRMQFLWQVDYSNDIDRTV